MGAAQSLHSLLTLARLADALDAQPRCCSPPPPPSPPPCIPQNGTCGGVSRRRSLLAIGSGCCSPLVCSLTPNGAPKVCATLPDAPTITGIIIGGGWDLRVNMVQGWSTGGLNVGEPGC